MEKAKISITYSGIVLVCYIVSIFSSDIERNCVYGEVDGECLNPFGEFEFISNKERKELPVCESKAPYGVIDLRESDNPSVFRDLTSKEIKGLLGFLYDESDLNLTRAEESNANTNYIFVADLFLPPKQEVLKHLDDGYEQPTREAHVVIFRGGRREKDVIEIVVGPLPYPTHYRYLPNYPKSLSFAARPPNFADDVSTELNNRVDRVLGDMLHELYGGRLVDCNDKCLAFNYGSYLSPALSGEKKRKRFQWLEYFVEYYLLRPLDFVVLIEYEDNNDFIISKIWFDGRSFDNLNDVLRHYQIRKHFIKRVQFPNIKTSSPLTVNARGKPPFDKPLKDPVQVSPDGKRYNINDRHVTYGDWSFDIGMFIFTGARLNDIRYKNERIAYEISIQEVANFYSGYRPFEYALSFLDTWDRVGFSAKFLMPGVDCPHDATFLGSFFKVEGKDKPQYNAHAFCVFEWNTGTPLRRHSGYYRYAHSFYEGVPSIAFVVRTIPTVVIYDYITDIIFYQNGAIEVKIQPTGVIASTWFSQKNPYSFQLSNNLMAPMHQHIFHVKMDLDIKGTRNRFETLDIESVKVKNEVNKDPSAYVIQDRFIRRLKSTEMEAAYKFNFDAPSYLTFVNDKKKDKFGNSPGYRLLNQGMTKLLRPTTEGNGPGISWAQYQVAVTKYKDSEPRSTAKYYVSDDNAVNFQNFIEDDESIVDKDLVAWVTMGLFHITSKEDIPVTHTPGLSRSTFLMPFNYFSESPGMSAGNAVRIDPKDVNDKTVGIKVRRSGVENVVDCVPRKNPILEILNGNPCIAFECL